MSVATNRRWKDKSGQKQEDVEFHRVTFFGAIAKVCGDYLKKGSQVYIEGRIKTNKYQKDGVDMYSTGIIGEQLHMLDTRSATGGDPGAYQGGQAAAPQASGTAPDTYPDFDDTIPF
jgi:single-strand DNA-binding protein